MEYPECWLGVQVTDLVNCKALPVLLWNFGNRALLFGIDEKTLTGGSTVGFKQMKYCQLKQGQ